MASSMSEKIQSTTYLLLFLYAVVAIPSANTTSFNYPRFESVPRNISLQGNASFTSDGSIELTPDELVFNIGRAIYSEPVRLWDSTTGNVADFTTHFSFVMQMFYPPNGGDGLAFFLAPNGSDIPPDSSGGSRLGLFNKSSMFNSSQNPIVAVEFDTFSNNDNNESDPNSEHVGIDVNSIRSKATWNVATLKNGSTVNVWISYNSSTQNLSVYLTFAQNYVFNGDSVLSYIVDLKRYLPEWINVGFSASTGSYIETHNILSWEFSSTDLSILGSDNGRKNKTNKKLVIGSAVGGSVLVVGVGLILLFSLRKKNRNGDQEDEISTDDDYEQGTGPKRFKYSDLLRATNNFIEERKLGEGGCGGVYQGILTDSNMGVDIAVKRILKGSKQGKKEFVSEVKIISQLRHRNLVQLIGWCHERGEFLLVYEFMPNGSLDYHLFGGRTMLTWVLRYKIALGLASALLYLHEEWEQCVVHRDIKASNVMLDSSFNAKLGDFGLARFVDHELGVKTTMLAGTMGYLAPECVVTGRAGKESDVYSFGVVALEIACGRRAVEPREEESKVGLVAWVWELYGSGRLLDAADSKLSMEFDKKQMECLMLVGLWCANLDHNLRPSIKQAISVLTFEAPLPVLPFKMSVPTFMTSMPDLKFSLTSSSSATATGENRNQTLSTSTSEVINSVPG